MDDVAGRAPQPPPLARGDQDGQGEQEQADAVAPMLRLELAGTVPDPAHSSPDDVGDTHPDGADGSHRQGCTLDLGRATSGCRLATRGFARRGLAVAALAPGRGGLSAAYPGLRTRNRGSRTSHHGRHGTRKQPWYHASHAARSQT